jgi:hypothetical protein
MLAYRAGIACMTACVVALATAACTTVSTTALESQSKQRDPRLARLYFIWPRSWMMKTGTLDIKINGEVVGKIAPDSYFFVDRKPGTYTLKIEPPFDFSYFEADVQVAAGATYYYSVNSRSATVGPLAGGGVVTMNPTPHDRRSDRAQERDDGDLPAQSDGCRSRRRGDERPGRTIEHVAFIRDQNINSYLQAG